MRTPHFVRLAEIDEQRFISACRHGMVHLSWGRATVRFGREEFRRLATLLDHLGRTPGMGSAREGEIEVTYRAGAECQVRAGAVVLVLSAAEYDELAAGVKEAVRALDEILNSGAWDRPETEEAARDFWEPLRRTPFSAN